MQNFNKGGPKMKPILNGCLFNHTEPVMHNLHCSKSVFKGMTDVNLKA